MYKIGLKINTKRHVGTKKTCHMINKIQIESEGCKEQFKQV